MNPRVALAPDMLISAVRYALGRRTYIVGRTVDEVLRVWDDLPERVRKVIVRDIQRQAPDLGHDMDAEQWQRILSRAAPGAGD